MLVLILFVLYKLITYIIYILFFAALLTWFPNIRWDKQPFVFIRNFMDFFFKPFRFVPPVGNIDISPMICFLALMVIQYLLGMIIANLV